MPERHSPSHALPAAQAERAPRWPIRPIASPRLDAPSGRADRGGAGAARERSADPAARQRGPKLWAEVVGRSCGRSRTRLFDAGGPGTVLTRRSAQACPDARGQGHRARATCPRTPVCARTPVAGPPGRLWPARPDFLTNARRGSVKRADAAEDATASDDRPAIPRMLAGRHTKFGQSQRRGFDIRTRDPGLDIARLSRAHQTSIGQDPAPPADGNAGRAQTRADARRARGGHKHGHPAPPADGDAGRAQPGHPAPPADGDAGHPAPPATCPGRTWCVSGTGTMPPQGLRSPPAPSRYAPSQCPRRTQRIARCRPRGLRRES